MPETLLRDFRVDTVRQQLRRMGMSQVVKAQLGQAVREGKTERENFLLREGKTERFHRTGNTLAALQRATRNVPIVFMEFIAWCTPCGGLLLKRPPER
jgi:hypothetical protein